MLAMSLSLVTEDHDICAGRGKQQLSHQRSRREKNRKRKLMLKVIDGQLNFEKMSQSSNTTRSTQWIVKQIIRGSKDELR